MELPDSRFALVAIGLLIGLGLTQLPWVQLPQRLAAYRIALRAPSIAEPRSPADLSLWAHEWLLSAEEAAQIIKDTNAVILDPRTMASSRLSQAVPIAWSAFTPNTTNRRGLLLKDDQLLARKLEALGVSSDRPVLVAGDPKAWGEDGRIVWMLRSLGHPATAMVDGGHPALVAALAAQAVQPVAPVPGTFVVQRNTTWSISRDRLRTELGQPDVVVIDSRTAAEYAGETPYGERRGGHVPGARHLHFESLMDSTGRLLPEPALLDQLSRAGITADKTIIVYCTGGVRSAWLTVVLTELGFTAKNYAGSMWEWSASTPEQYPLVRLASDEVP